MEINSKRRICRNNQTGIIFKSLPGKQKLPDLENNIKCGNSLIHNNKFTDKPFNWKTEFDGKILRGVGLM